MNAEECQILARQVCTSPPTLKQLFTIAATADVAVANKAAWCLCNATHSCPQVIKKYTVEIIGWIKQNRSEAIVRNALRMCMMLPIPSRCEGELVQSCFEILEKENTGSAPKAFALHLLNDFVKKYPDLLPEIKLIIEHRWPLEKAAFHSAARKLLKNHTIQ